MTVNERLFAMGKVGEFDSAIRKNQKTAISILVQCELPIKVATDTVAAIVKEPREYGTSMSASGIHATVRVD